MSMACFTSTALREAGNLVAKPSIKRRNVSLRAADMSASHFGTKALEEFEKSELGQLNMEDLTALSEQVKQRGDKNWVVGVRATSFVWLERVAKT